jgi:hypothetical protein
VHVLICGDSEALLLEKLVEKLNSEPSAGATVTAMQHLAPIGGAADMPLISSICRV